jgi:uncharacterized YigZ family protein
MSVSDTYKTLKNPTTGIYKEKGSKFLAFAFPVSDEQEIREIQLKIRKEHHSARHHCFAWRLGHENEEYRINDDGEPSGTAGRPIFNQIKANDLTNILIVVVRYFGGILLGTSGLTNAYRQAAADAISQGEIIEKVVEDLIEVHFDYLAMNEYMHIVKEMQLKQLRSEFLLECTAVLSVRKSLTETVLEKLNSAEKIKASPMKK